ncbi:hypothetical protein PGTUg99_021672 [Puccinia graminis f. sp. tritici]|uniref:Uncharacterized protein n=1 Tax=Puccinia graminis f. sp. tritici TaxID=56615 RepID=A0A5B0S084_PUCGR|nr:hypothetical protein PGTUg99_021672 [Puccinia graminis f. sp. tritici]
MSDHNAENHISKPQSTNEMDHLSSEDSDVQLPHRCSSLSRSIVEFCKFMMGGTGASFQLPPPPTPEELQAWKGWVAERQAKVDGHHEAKECAPETDATNVVDKINQNIQPRETPSHYQSAPRPANCGIANLYKILCDRQFQSNGFSRITFEWGKSSLKESEWNSATADILADQWGNWYIQNRLFSTKANHNINARAIIGRWLRSASKIPARQSQNEDRTSEEIALINKAKSEAAEGRRKNRSAVAAIRRKTIETIFPRTSHKWESLITSDTVSDFEESDDPADPPTRILPFWRSKVLGDFMRALDLASFQLAGPSDKHQLSAFLARNGCREANEDDAYTENVPGGLPEEAFSKQFWTDTSDLERRQLAIYNPTARCGATDVPNISQALTTVQKVTYKP